VAIARLRPKAGIEKLTFSVPATSSLEIFRRSLSEFQSGKFTMTFSNTSTNEVKSLEFSLVNNNSSLRSTAFSKLGKKFDVDVIESIDSGDVIITVTNSEAFQLELILAEY
jgi:hypothetical protein